MFNLQRVAANLEALEETIIHKLIDRAQYCVNERAYEAGHSGFRGEPERCLLRLRLRHQEEMDARFGRFGEPVECPFTYPLPAPHREVVIPDTGLSAPGLEGVNLTGPVLEAYLDLVPRMCPPGDDSQYGSSTEHDVYALQAISRRIHYGAFFVGESKYRTSPEIIRDIVARADREELLAAITRLEVEQTILARVAEKMTYLQARVNRQVRHVIDSEVVLAFYRDTIIPLTKEGQILYLSHRATNGEEA